jgi:hypothetical protein
VVVEVNQMRMWMVDPKLLCRKHLLGEHGEIHKHRHNFVKGHKIAGRIFPIVTIEPENMEKRHDALAEEMLERGYNHQSPYIQPDISKYEKEEIKAKVDIKESKRELIKRCLECSKKINNLN